MASTSHLYPWSMMVMVITLLSGCGYGTSSGTSVETSVPAPVFNPLCLPSSFLFKDTPWLDPLVFNSDRAYSIKGIDSSIKVTEARYTAGPAELIAYLKNRTLQRVPIDCGWLKPPTLHFMINTQGEVDDTRIVQSSGNKEVDDILMDLISEMPAWTPAQNQNGERVAQAFEFSVRQDAC